MGKMLGIYLLDEVSFIRLFGLLKLGYIHPKDSPGIVRGIMVGFWRFEIQLILGFWENSEINNKGVGHA